MAITLMRQLERPLLLEGEAGVGKTEVGKALARMLERPLIRLQCYEGLDANAAVYEWNYQRQLLAIKIRESEDLSAEAKEAHIFQRDFLLERPLLQGDSGARAGGPSDRRDRPRRRGVRGLSARGAVRLSDQHSRARHDHRDLDPLGGPDLEPHPRAVATRCGAAASTTMSITRARTRRSGSCSRAYRASRRSSPDRSCASCRRCARRTCARPPGVAETLDFAAALLGLGVRDLPADPGAVSDALLCLLKTHEDQSAVRREVVERLLGKVA